MRPFNLKSINVLIPPTPVREKEIESLMWEDTFNLKLYSLEDYERLLTPMEICYFAWKHGLYQLPTIEFIEHLKLHMIGANVLLSDVIEIGAGAGQIGRHLGIRMTDSKLQEEPEIQAYYAAVGQPLIKYHPDVEKIDANSAVIKYQPKIVIGCWITEFPQLIFGVKEPEMMKLINQYVFVGNRIPHTGKPLLEGRSSDYYPWLVSRSFHPEENRIWIINN